MKIQMISAVVVIIVFVVTSANAKNVPQSPVENNQSRSPKPSARMPSNKINFPISHIEAPQKSTVKSPASTTTVTYKSINTTATKTVKVPVLVPATTIDGMAQNTFAKTPIKETANNGTATTSIGGTANVDTLAIHQEEEKETVRNKHIIIPPTIQSDKNMCPDGYTVTNNGDCSPKFPDK